MAVARFNRDSRSPRIGWRTKKNGGQEAQALGRSRGGFSSKIHVAVDALGLPLRFILTGGQAHDAPIATQLLEDFAFDAVLADGSYDSDAIVAYINEQNAEAVIPSRSNRKVAREYDQDLYKARHLVECFINKIKHFRRIFSRFEKYAKRYLAYLSFVSVLIWLR